MSTKIQPQKDRLERQERRMVSALNRRYGQKDTVIGTGDQLPRLEALVSRLGYTLEYADCGGYGNVGGADPAESLIAISPKLAPAVQVHTLAHEIIHVMGCQGGESRRGYAQAEITCDMAAAMACGVLGLDAFDAAVDVVGIFRYSAEVDARELLPEAREWAAKLLEELDRVEL